MFLTTVSLVLPLVLIFSPATTIATTTTTIIPYTYTYYTSQQQPQQQSQPQPKEYVSPLLFKNTILSVTNAYRAQHNATQLVWNDTLALYATKWSQRCVFEHSEGPYGENLASGYPNTTTSVIAWASERQLYPFKSPNPTFSLETGHFTQLVWKSTTSMGCGRTQCNGRVSKYGKPSKSTAAAAAAAAGNGDKAAPGWFVVCEYDPPGNVLGRFKENVQDRYRAGTPAPPVPGLPEVEDQQEECPQGAVCPSGAERLRTGMGIAGSGKFLAIWVAIGVVLCL